MGVRSDLHENEKCNAVKLMAYADSIVEQPPVGWKNQRHRSHGQMA